MKNQFYRCYIDFDCVWQEEYLKDIFEICGEIFQNIRSYNFEYDVLQFDVRDNFDGKCNCQINGSFSIIKNDGLKILCLTIKRKNISYNAYHTFGHFLQKQNISEQKKQQIYQEYLEKSDVFDLPNDCSVIIDECIPQLIAHYFLNELNDQAKNFVQEKILK